MNSIDTFIPVLIPQLESEEGVTMPSMTGPDAAALEALRALMGGMVPQPQALGTAASSSSDSAAFLRPSAPLPALLEQLLQSDSLPPALIPLLTSLRSSLQKGAPAHSDPALASEIKTLLREMMPAQAVFSKDTDLGQPFFQPAGGIPSSTVVPPSATSLPTAATTVSGAPAALLDEGNSASSIGLPVDLPADVPTLAQQLLQMLDEAPPNGFGGVARPSFEGLVDDEPSITTTPDRPADTQNLGSAILQTLGHQPVPAAAQSNGQAGATERVTEVSNLITQMADRVLVTDPLHGQTQEVRIKIADNVMEGTEVRVWREDGGALHVEFDTTSAYWSRILNEASPLLSQRLNERLPSGTEAQVTVQQQGHQPEDGRSRNRQNPWELAQQALES